MNGTGTSIIIGADGTLRCLYDESIDLHQFGDVTIQRASHVEPDSTGRWLVDLSPVGGPRLHGRFNRRSDALAAERTYLLPRLHQIVVR